MIALLTKLQQQLDDSGWENVELNDVTRKELTGESETLDSLSGRDFGEWRVPGSKLAVHVRRLLNADTFKVGCHFYDHAVFEKAYNIAMDRREKNGDISKRLPLAEWKP